MLSSVLDPIPREVILIVSTLLGMFGHYAKKRALSQTNVTACEWFGSVNVFGTISSILLAVTTVVGIISNNMITPDMNVYTVIYIGLTSGFAADSAANGDNSKPVDPPY